VALDQLVKPDVEPDFWRGQILAVRKVRERFMTLRRELVEGDDHER
jgi:hypothetical protein